MNVVHGLSGTGVYVEHRTVTLLMDIRLHRYFLGNLEHLADERIIVWHQII